MTDYTEADAAAERLQRCREVGPDEAYNHLPPGRHAEDLIDVAEVYQQLRDDLAAARAERDEARQAAADWRTLCDGRYWLPLLALADDMDRRPYNYPPSHIDAARRLAAPHLNPPAEGGGK